MRASEPSSSGSEQTADDAEGLLQRLQALPGLRFVFKPHPGRIGTFSFAGLDRSDDADVGAVTELSFEALSESMVRSDRLSAREQLSGSVKARSPFEVTVRLHDAAGALRWLRFNGQPKTSRRDGTLSWRGLVREVTREQREAAFGRAQRNLLERIATGVPLPTALDDVCRLVEQTIGGAFACVALLDPMQRTLRYCAGPSLNRRYVESLLGQQVGPDAGSCGTAMYYGTPVVSPDISTDLKWALYRELADAEGLKACWSVPFFGADGKVAGALSAYFAEVRHPTPAELEVLKTVAHVAGIAAQRTAMLEALHSTEEQLRLVQKMEAVGQLSGGVAHDFNNILTVIRGSASLLVDSLPADSEAKSDAELIVQATDRAEALTRQLLTFGRRQAWKPIAVSVNEVVERNQVIIQRLLGERVAMQVALQDDLPAVWLDPSQLEQVLMNVAVNARDAMPQGGELSISTQLYEVEDETADLGAPAGASFVRIEVRDRGTGMNSATLARVFEPFFSTKPRETNSGLGLSVAYGIVERAGGKISLTSKANQGTTVRIDLPASAEEPTVHPRAAGSLPHASLARNRCVLLVEDEAMVRALAARTLRSRGYEVVEAEDGLDGLRALEARAGGFDAVVSDVVMPHMTGTELAEAIRDRWPELPVLLMTGYADDLALLGARSADAPPLLSKPFTPSQLAAELQRALGD